MSKLMKTALACAKNQNLFEVFVEAGMDYSPERLQAELENLKTWECYDYEELWAMRAANDNAAAEVALSVVESDDGREQVRENRDGESQAPPPLSKEAKIAASDKMRLGKISDALSKVAFEQMICLVDRGVSVFPVHSIDKDGDCTCQYSAKKLAKEYRREHESFCSQGPGKHPKVAGGSTAATREFEQIGRWFEEPKNRFGPTNIGMTCGKDYGTLAIDIDGETGFASLEKLTAELGPLPKTVTVRTGSGGLHFYFRYPDGWEIRNSISALGWEGSKIDVRGDNGYAVIPPSRHKSGGEYSWVEGCSFDDVVLAELPEAWIKAAWLAKKENREATSVGDENQAPTTHAKQSNPFIEAGGTFTSIDAIGIDDSFNKPVFQALCSFFGKNGPDAECSAFLDEISIHVTNLIEAGKTSKERYRYTMRDGGTYLREQARNASQFIRDNPHKEGEGEQANASSNLDALLAALPSPASMPVLPIEQVETIMNAVAAEMVAGNDGAWVKAVDVLKPYGRPKAALMALLNSAKNRFKSIGEKPGQGAGGKHVDSKLNAMNERYAVVVIKGQVKIVDTKDPDGYSFMSDAAFKLLHANNRMQIGGEKWVSVADEWLKWPERRTFAGVEFAPGGGRKGYLNLFTGYAYKGKGSLDNDTGTGWELLDSHIFENVCQGGVDHYHWFMTWFADIIQNPEDKKGSCVIVRGKQGAGKSTVFDIFRELLGACSLKTDKMETMTGRFNGAMSGKLLIQLEEGFFAGSHQAKSVMKNLVTSSELLIERKGLEGLEEKNFSRIAITSNDEWLMSMAKDDRRYFVLECGDGKLKDNVFFGQVWDQMRNGGFEAFMFDLQNWEPDEKRGGWSMLRNPPLTKWAEDQIILSLSPEDKFFELWDEGEEITANRDELTIQRNLDGITEVPRSAFSAHFDAHMRLSKGGLQEKIGNAKWLWNKCKERYPGIEKERVGKENKLIYRFPRPVECMATT